MFCFFFCKQETAYDMRISDWSSDVCSSDLTPYAPRKARAADWSADAEPFRDDRMYNAALRTDYDVTDNLTLTSITSYSDYKRNSRAADDGTAVQDYDYVANDGYIRDFNQELR